MVKARESDRLKSEFLANMSHELRTPLNHIIGFTELVTDRHLGELNETQSEYLNDVLKSSKHLLSLINDILDLSKIEAGKLELAPSEVALKQLLKDSLAMVRPMAESRHLGLVLDLDGIPEVIKADERKLKQVIYNLMANAVKFTPDGGRIRLAADLVDGNHTDPSAKQRPMMVPSHQASPRFVRISVEDNGIGIGFADQKRIFDPFEQVENSASRRYQGTGLGLSLSKTLVELHGGTIWVESAGENQGAVFRLTLPI
jgi:signal transduction histidine kinase